MDIKSDGNAPDVILYLKGLIIGFALNADIMTNY